MVDWTDSMIQTYEFYEVDPNTWGDIRKLDTVESCTIKYDSSLETLATATIDLSESLGEIYFRVYLSIIQNEEHYRYPLGTFLMQTPNVSFDGKVKKVSVDAYSPLIELKEKKVPNGYTILKGQNIMDVVSDIVRENLRAPVVSATASKNMDSNFTSNIDDTWMSFINDALAVAEYKFDLDDKCEILFAPRQDTKSLQPVWTFDDSNSSILYPDISVKRDLYGMPNVVEVLYSSGSGYMYSRVENNDPDNPLSIQNRGREIVYRDSNPSFGGKPTQKALDEYAKQLLRNQSTLECTLTYTHGYCPVRVGDCVRLNYKGADLHNVKAVVTSQSIKCEPGCPVSETATFTSTMWGN